MLGGAEVVSWCAKLASSSAAARVLGMYDRAFAGLYGFVLTRWRGDDYMASWGTAVGLAGAVMMNALLILTILGAWYGFDTAVASVLRWAAIAGIGGLFLVTYMVFIRNDRYQGVIRQFEMVPRAERRRIVIIAWMYVVLSYGAPVVAIFSLAWPDMCVDQATNAHRVMQAICQVLS